MTPAQSRNALGLSVNQFAAALGVSPVTVRRWEMSDDKPSHRKPGEATMTAIRLLLANRPANRSGADVVK
jgi:DNA-binding transcriptional regulator YiaG